MDFEWTEAERTARERVVAILDADERARIAATEEADVPALRESVRRGHRRLAEAGYWEVALGPAGDAHTPARTAMDLELAAASASHFLGVQTTRHVAGLVAGWGSDALRNEWLAPLIAGDRIGALALPDPGGAADGTPVAVAGEGGSWTLTGRRPFVAHAPIADVLAVFADAGGRTMIAFLRPDDPGVRIGERLRLLGLGGLATAPLDLDGARVPAERVVGPLDGDAPQSWCRRSRDLGLAIAGVGLMRRALDAAKAHAATHRRGGKPIVARQEIAFRLAEMTMMTQTAEWLACRAAWMIGAADPEAGTLVRCAKVFCSESAEKASSGAMQVLAGQACVAGNDVERAWREAKAIAMLGTTAEVARMAIAADLLARH